MGHANGCIRGLVCFLAFLTWLSGGLVAGFMLWILVTSSHIKQFLTGDLIFTYVIFGLGGVWFFTGLVGWVGAYRRGACLMMFFLLLSVLVVAAEIGGIIVLNILKIKVADILEQSWTEMNQRSRNLIQEQFECCGFSGPREILPGGDNLGDSCYIQVGISGESTTVHELRQLNRTGCKEKLVDWFYGNKSIWMASLGGLLLYQVITILLSVSAINYMKKYPTRESLVDEYVDKN